MGYFVPHSRSMYVPDLVPEFLELPWIPGVDLEFFNWLDEHSILELPLSKDDASLDVRVLADDIL